jgi:hypothetical protein
MVIDIEIARQAKKELTNYLEINNIKYNYIGLSTDCAEWIIIVGITTMEEFQKIPDHINDVRIKKEFSEKIVALGG